MIVIRDANGKYFPVKEEDLVAAIFEYKFKLFGMDLDAMRQFRLEYDALAGQQLITKETIHDLFFQLKKKSYQ